MTGSCPFDDVCYPEGSVGYRVQRAYDGLTALSLAKVVKPDGALAGADACLRQPCPAGRLLRIVAEVMGQPRGLRADAGA